MITSQAESPERLQRAIDAGGLYWEPKTSRYVKSLKTGTGEFANKPHVVGITRELEFGRPGFASLPTFSDRASDSRDRSTR